MFDIVSQLFPSSVSLSRCTNTLAGKVLVQGKSMLKYQMHESIQQLLKIAGAYEDRSLKKLEKILDEQTVEDPVVSETFGCRVY